MPSNHAKALNYYKTHQNELVAKYNGKTIIFQDESIVDIKDTFTEAYDYAVLQYGEGNFSLQEVSPGSESFTAFIATPGVVTYSQ